MTAARENIAAGLVHGTAVYWPDCDGAVLLTGASGAGKSDLALRLIDRGWRLVADDQVLLWVEDAQVWAAAPDALRNTIALPGLGICHEPAVERAKIGHIVHLTSTGARFPLDRGRQSVCGVALPVVALDGLAASAPLRVERFVKGVML